MADESFDKILEDFQEKRKNVDEVCDEYNSFETAPSITDQQLEENSFFKTELAESLINVFKRFLSGETLSDREKNFFSSSTQFIWNFVKATDNGNRWLTKQDDLIKLSIEGLNDVASNGRNISFEINENQNLDSFAWLLRSFELIKSEELLESLFKIVTSQFYSEALDKIRERKPSTLSSTENFLLITCPNYIFNVEHHSEFSKKIVEKNMEIFLKTLEDFLGIIKEWSAPILLSLVYPIKFLGAATDLIKSTEKEKLYETISTIIHNKDSIDFDNERARNSFLYYTLCLLLECLRRGQDFIRKIRTKGDESKKLTEILKSLAKTELNNRIRLKAMEIVSLIVTEDEFLENESPEEIAGFYVKNLSETLQIGDQKRSNEILNGLRDMIQNDDVKKELVKQQGLPVLVKFAKQTDENPLPLDISYAMTFNNDAKKYFNEDQEFLDHVRKLKQSEKREIAQLANGIIWKLEGEEKFRNQEKPKIVLTEKGKDSEKTNEKPKYDMMISYCWAQKELCHKINDRLESEGFQVWLDRDEMHGSIVEAMAEAIESSRCVLICMSSNYKKSTNCKSEAEYAYNRKSKIIPLVVEPGYQADGWLGIIAGSKLYVDFADKEGPAFDEAYQLLIAELKRNDLADKYVPSENSDSVTAKKPPAEEKKPTTEEEKSTIEEGKPSAEEEKPSDKAKKTAENPKIPTPTTKEYLNAGFVPSWSEQNVLEFLNDQQMEALLPICETMDGSALIEFHQACQTSIHQLFPLINQDKSKNTITLAVFFKFISRLKKFLPAPPQQKIAFKYNFVYPQNENKL